jgi:RNA polymerase sigma-70 factor (ECF subfamily)
VESERSTATAIPDAQAADLYGRYRPQIYRYCMGRLRSREDAEDATQNVFLRVCTALRKGVVPELEAPWLYKIAHNVCLSRALGLKRRARVERPADVEAFDVAAPAAGRPDELLGLEDALADMPENLRRVMLLREWQGLSYAEIADTTGQTQAAVETLIFRARRHLAKALAAVNVATPLVWARRWLWATAAPAKLAAGSVVVGLASSGVVLGLTVAPASSHTTSRSPQPVVLSVGNVPILPRQPKVAPSQRIAKPRAAAPAREAALVVVPAHHYAAPASVAPPTTTQLTSAIAARPAPPEPVLAPAAPVAVSTPLAEPVAPEPQAPAETTAPAETSSPQPKPAAETTTVTVADVPVEVPTVDVPPVEAPAVDVPPLPTVPDLPPPVPPVTVPKPPPVPTLP